ncbi:MAG: Ni/Fe hydrogenase subunit alpha [Planctomycetota bacterium]
MSKHIVIDPVTRIEGHAKITIHLGDDGAVTEARFHITQFRGFEKFCVGRPVWEMPGITSRICGICPVSHLLASAKTGDQILAVRIPPAAVKLRRLLNLAQIVQSHALSFFHLSSPDLLLGMDAPPETRHIFQVAKVNPELARGGIRLRQFGQNIIDKLGGRKIHPVWAIPGGVRSPLSPVDRDELATRIPESMATIRLAIQEFKSFLDRFGEEVDSFGRFPSLFLGMVGPEGEWEHYDGNLRLMDAEGNLVLDQFDPARFGEVIGEATENWSFLKSPYYRPLGYPGGFYRVGPLARLNVCSRIGTEEADRELEEFRRRAGRVALCSFQFHYARLIEILASLERIAQLLADPELQSDRTVARAYINAREGVGASEAPRGTLFHHYKVDANGVIEAVNLLIATGQNNLAMNHTVTQIAKRYIHGTEIPEGMLNRVEAGIRSFDPCLSCSTHAVGSMPLRVQLFDPAGAMLDEVVRNGT